MKSNFSKEKCEKILELLEINYEIINDNIPEKFWFYHNGITIYSYDDKNIKRSNNIIRLNPDMISVINGAQTITNFYDALEEIKYDLFNILKKVKFQENNEKEWINSQLKKVCKKIKVKTIIIDGSKEYINKVSVGLNTQIPIEDESILANSKYVFIINNNLKNSKVNIVRDGELCNEGDISVLDYVKKYLIINLQPGKSKNLNKNELATLLKDSVKKVQMRNLEKYEIINKFRQAMEKNIS